MKKQKVHAKIVVNTTKIIFV